MDVAERIEPCGGLDGLCLLNELPAPPAAVPHDVVYGGVAVELAVDEDLRTPVVGVRLEALLDPLTAQLSADFEQPTRSCVDLRMTDPFAGVSNASVT